MTASIGFDIFARDRASKTFKGVGDSADKTGKRFEGMSGKLKSAAKVGLLGLAGGAVIAGGALLKMTKSAIEDEAGQKRLATALRNSAGATQTQVAATESWISKQGTALGVTDDELRPALGRLVASTHDVGKGQKLAALAMNISAGSGKSLGAVSQALAKAQDGNVAGLARLGVKTKDAAGNTRSLKDITADLATTYGGQAAAKANTFQGKMDRLKLVLGETGESIGSKLLPPLTKLATWVLTKVVPSVTRFVAGMQNGTGEGGRLAAKLRALGSAVMSSVGFLNKHRTIVLAVIGAFVAWKAAMVAINVVNKVALGITKAQTAGVAIYTGVSKGITIATKAWAVAQRVLNVVLRANPIGLVITAVALLAGGLVLAYKKSETFRKVVKGAFEGIATAGRWLWNSVLAPVFRFMVRGMGDLMMTWGTMLQKLGKVPGFGWAKAAGDKMYGAGEKAVGLAGKIRNIPDRHPKVNVSTTGKRGVDAVRESIRLTNGKTVLVNVKVRRQVQAAVAPMVDFWGAPRASGGRVRAGGSYMVGESRREMFVPDSAGRVMSGAATERVMSGGGGARAAVASQPQVVEVHLHLDGRTIVQQVRAYKRGSGGGPTGIG